MLIKMINGGMVNYEDDCYCYGGCPTCNYGSEYINEIDITLTRYKIHIKLNQMYQYSISEWQMIKLFLTEYNTISWMKEKEFIDWFKEKLGKMINDNPNFYDGKIERFDVEELS